MLTKATNIQYSYGIFSNFTRFSTCLDAQALASFSKLLFSVIAGALGSDVDRSWVKCALGEEIPLVFGAPHMPGGYSLFPYNFTTADSMISLAVITYWANFAKNG